MNSKIRTPHPGLAEPITIAQCWKNRRKDAVRIRISDYEGTILIDVRTWHGGADGKLKPGKGFCSQIKHLPRLAAELTKAMAKARELGLLETEVGNG